MQKKIIQKHVCGRLIGLFIASWSWRDEQGVDAGHFIALCVPQWLANNILHAWGIIYEAHSSNRKLKAVTVPITPFYLFVPLLRAAVVSENGSMTSKSSQLHAAAVL